MEVEEKLESSCEVETMDHQDTQEQEKSVELEEKEEEKSSELNEDWVVVDPSAVHELKSEDYVQPKTTIESPSNTLESNKENEEKENIAQINNSTESENQQQKTPNFDNTNINSSIEITTTTTVTISEEITKQDET